MTTSLKCSKDRRAFTIVETILALALIAIGAGIVSEVAAWSILERSRMEIRLAAIEWTANVLESARAQPWEKLTAEWANAQQPPAELTRQMNTPISTVKVEIDSNRPRVKRVIVEIRWKLSDGTPAQPVVMQSAFAARRVP